MKKIVLIVILLLCFLTGTAFAAKMKAVPGVQESDFICRQLMLGDSFDGAEKKLNKTLLFDNDRTAFGQKIKYYTFKDGYVVGVNESGTVVDIVIKDHDYIGRNGMRYGATKAKIGRVFGIVPRQFIDGVTWQIYERPGMPEHRLMLEIDVNTNTLYSWRITSLPLTQEEADRRSGKYDDEWESNDFNAVMMRNKDIDMTAIAKVRIRN